MTMTMTIKSISYSVALALGLVLGVASEPQAAETDDVTLVGHTFDACDKKHKVVINGKSIKAGQTRTVRLGHSQNETWWLCGGTRERFANGRPYNAVRITRAGNGAMSTEFLVK